MLAIKVQVECDNARCRGGGIVPTLADAGLIVTHDRDDDSRAFFGLGEEIRRSLELRLPVGWSTVRHKKRGPLYFCSTKCRREFEKAER